MPLLKHPTSGSILNVNGARATVLKGRGYTEVDSYDYPSDPPSAVVPQPPIDARENPPEPPVDARAPQLITDPPIDMRPPNPAGPVAHSVAEADASLPDPDPEPADDDEDQDDESVDRPAKSAPKEAWVEYATAQGVQDADDLSKAALIELLDA
jgi:hypothetical protein